MEGRVAAKDSEDSGGNGGSWVNRGLRCSCHQTGSNQDGGCQRKGGQRGSPLLSAEKAPILVGVTFSGHETRDISNIFGSKPWGNFHAAIVVGPSPAAKGSVLAVATVEKGKAKHLQLTHTHTHTHWENSLSEDLHYTIKFSRQQEYDRCQIQSWVCTKKLGKLHGF